MNGRGKAIISCRVWLIYLYPFIEQKDNARMCGEPLTPQFRRNHNSRQVHVNLDLRRLFSPPNDPISPAHRHNARQPTYLPFFFLTRNIWQRWKVETKRRELRLYNNGKWRGCGHELKAVNKKKRKKKSPKEAQTPIEEDTYIYNVHVYGFFFVVENQKKKHEAVS